MSYHSAAIFGLALLGVALGTAAVRAARTGGWRWLLSAVVVALVGAGGACPFFSDRAMGTGEAFNYHLAVADANAQLRSGEFPALVRPARGRHRPTLLRP